MKAEPIDVSPERDGLPQRAPRRNVDARAFLILPGYRVIEVRLLDMSLDGCQVETPQFLYKNDAVRLSIPDRMVIEAHVRWCREGKAGLKFQPAEPEPEPKPDRNIQRRNATTQVELRRIGQLKFTVNVHDVSLTGCRVELVERPRVGEVMQIKFPGLEVLDATVCWVDGFVAGLQFNRPFHPAVFDLLMARIGG